MGEPLEKEVVRAIQFMILVNLGTWFLWCKARGFRASTVVLNHQIVPFAPGDGSVGYLSPEAHMALLLIGEGKAWYKGELISGKEALAIAGLQPVSLGCKEGLALINGTTSVTAFASLALYKVFRRQKQRIYQVPCH